MDAYSEPASHASIDARRVGDGSPALRSTGITLWRDTGFPGYWAVLDIRATVNHPAGWGISSPMTDIPLLPSEMLTPWAPWKLIRFSRLIPRGPHACVPTHRRIPLPTSTQGSLLTCRAQRWSGRTCTYWTTYRISGRHRLLPFQRTSIAWPLLAFASMTNGVFALNGTMATPTM